MKYRLICFLVPVFLLVILPDVKAASEELLGDGDDGNRTDAVHLMPLLDGNGIQIRTGNEKPEPVSIRTTCGECHDYGKISQGWHFTFSDPKVPGGRIGEPWILQDSLTRTQLPISNRGWKGTFKPEELGITPWEFTKLFSSHNPGGGYGEMEAGDDDPDAMIRQGISGMYEINCLACHNADRRQHQSDGALQAARQNYRWVATQASGLGVVGGTASALSDFFDPEFDEGITVEYNKSIFNANDDVFIDIARKPPANRCYFCHSTQKISETGQPQCNCDEDVHIKAGLTCADCHRNELEHMIVRGYEGEQNGSGHKNRRTLTCRGCHIGDEESNIPVGGRLGAPYPEHAGIPVIHFDKLSCTACHSGAWPEDTAGIVKTARVHKLGLHGKHKVEMSLPHIYSPVFVKGEDGKIEPHKLFFPAYWAIEQDGNLKPLLPETVKEAADTVLKRKIESEDISADWRPLGLKEVGEVLTLLAGDNEGRPVYIAGGKMYQLVGDSGQVEAIELEAEAAYSWPIAHDVRPATQSLGVRNCKDCHTTDSGFFFGTVTADSPVISAEKSFEMFEFEGLGEFLTSAFAFSFVFRPWLKITVICTCGLIAAVLVLYGLKAVGCISKAAAEEE